MKRSWNDINASQPYASQSKIVSQPNADLKPERSQFSKTNNPDSSDSDEDFPAKYKPNKTESTFIEFFADFIKDFSHEVSEKIDKIKNSQLKKIKSVTLETSKGSSREKIIKFFYQEDLKKITEDVEKLNAILDSNNASDISDQFVVAQFRGIHYATDNWMDREERYGHYKKSLIGKPIFSKAVYKAVGLQYQQHPSIEQEEMLLKEANYLRDLLLKMREEKNIEVSFETQSGHVLKKLTYAHKADVMSNLFSSNLEQFLKAMEEGKFGDEIKNRFRAEIPYVATGDIPYHALKYAYGVKPYSQKANDRMRLPSSKNDHQSDFYFRSGLHVGKVILTLHSLSDFNEENGVVHTLEKVFVGNFYLDPSILHEQETSFFAYIPAERVVQEFNAKYPAFKGEYKESYLYKYGLDQLLYDKFKEILSIDDKNKKELASRLLGDYLCRFQEAKLLYQALLESKRRNKILVFKNFKSGRKTFSLYPISSKEIPDKKPPLDFKVVKSIRLISRNEQTILDDSLDSSLFQVDIPLEADNSKEKQMRAMSDLVDELQAKNRELATTVQDLEKQVKILESVIEKNTGVKDFTTRVVGMQAAIRGFFARSEMTKEEAWQLLGDLAQKRKLKEICELSQCLEKGNVWEISETIKRFKRNEDEISTSSQNIEAKSWISK